MRGIRMISLGCPNFRLGTKNALNRRGRSDTSGVAFPTGVKERGVIQDFPRPVWKSKL